MPRVPRLLPVLLSLLLAASLGALAPSTYAATPDRPDPAELAADVALERALAVLAGSPGLAPAGGQADPSLVLADLFASRSALDDRERQIADALLARPTQGAKDPYGDGYTTKSRRKCTRQICLHWVPTTADAPPSLTWVNRSLKTMQQVWGFEVGKLNYRKPIPDGKRGGDKRFDVYLKDVGTKGYYGYCAAEAYAPNDRDLASGYCVLDNDFSRDQFHAPPRESLRVTAAHEFFHAIQYAYDFAEDRWFMEATATWMEERFADLVDDNRNYLPAGQLRRPGTPLDVFENGGGAQYGNWLFFEYLSTRWGRGTVRTIWSKAGAFKGAPDHYSTQAVVGYVRSKKVPFTSFYASFAGANTIPGRVYPEGSNYTPSPTARTWTVGLDSPRTGPSVVTLDHLTTTTIAFVPGDALTEKDWKLRIALDLPSRFRGSTGYLLVHRTGGRVDRRVVTVDKSGAVVVKTPFSASSVARVKLVLVNGSTRFACWKGTSWSCRGKSRDDDLTFQYGARIVR